MMETLRRVGLTLVGCVLLQTLWAARILVPMDDSQTNHLKAYGVAFWVLENGVEVEWLLNYRGGSFLLPNIPEIQNECVIRGVSHQVIADVQAGQILQEIADPEVNMERVKLEVTPKIAVYSPEGKQPWDDAVTLVLTYAEIPYDVVYDTEILTGELPQYDWLHLHHEDFTGQYGKFYRAYRSAAWYQEEVARQTGTAEIMGFQKVSEMKRTVATTSETSCWGEGSCSRCVREPTATTSPSQLKEWTSAVPCLTGTLRMPRRNRSCNLMRAWRSRTTNLKWTPWSMSFRKSMARRTIPTSSPSTTFSRCLISLPNGTSFPPC